MSLQPIDSFDDLEDILRNWRSFADSQVYDLAGMAALVAACLDNLRTNALEAELEEIGRCFTDVQKEFLSRLAMLCSQK